MIVIMPKAPAKYDQGAIDSILDFIKRSFIPTISKDEAVNRVILQSPNGTSYEVKVDDSGTISTTQI